MEYLGSLTDEYIRSGLLITSANPSSTKQKGSGPIAASLAGVVEDRLSGRVMISGYSLADKTENAQTVVQAMDNARGARYVHRASTQIEYGIGVVWIRALLDHGIYRRIKFGRQTTRKMDERTEGQISYQETQDLVPFHPILQEYVRILRSWRSRKIWWKDLARC